MPDERKSDETKIRDHLANERTFLAWLRTSIAIMAFGFVVEKFSLFLHQIQYLVNVSNLATFQKVIPNNNYGYSSWVGVCLILVGEITCILAFFKYKETQKQISNDGFQPSALLNIMLTLAVALIGLSLVIYLLHSIVI